jgi:serine protease Do
MKLCWLPLALLTLNLAAQPLLLPEVSETATDNPVDIPEEVINKVDPSVVSIQHENAGGTGFIISEDGYILSNGHVVRGDDPEQPMKPAKSITVILHDERKVSARVLGFSMDPDVALLKIEMEEPLQPVELADSTNVLVGQRCFAVGTPVGLKRTFTSGILSNTRRTDLDTETVVFQTDAAINSGNSGGPLFDRQGRVLGINTYASRGQNNLGFTIPIHVAMDMVEDLKTRGRFVRSLVPLYFTSELYDELRRALEVDSGILISYVKEDSSAYRMGMRFGDILVAVNGDPVSAQSKAQLLDFEWRMTTMPAGEEVAFTVLRGSPGDRTELTLTGVLEELPPFPAFGRHLGQLPEHYYETLGLGVEELTDLHDIIHHIPDNPEGVFIKTVDEGSVASRADLQPGDVIERVAGQPTPTIEVFRRELDKALASGESEIIIEGKRDRLRKKTALAPDYLMRDRRILLVAPAGLNPDVDVILRELWAKGADITLATPGAQPIPRQHLETPVEAGLDLNNLGEPDMDILLLVDGPGAEAFSENEQLLSLISNTLKKQDAVLACIGSTALLPLLASEEPLKQKITMPRELSGRGVTLGANYTGNAVESEDKLVTTTGADRDVIRQFLRAVANKR